MDKKSIINDLYQAVVISGFCHWLLNAGKEDTENDTSKHPEV